MTILRFVSANVNVHVIVELFNGTKNIMDDYIDFSKQEIKNINQDNLPLKKTKNDKLIDMTDDEFVDATGNAAGPRPYVINRANGSSDTISGATSQSITTSYGHLTVIATANSWLII